MTDGAVGMLCGLVLGGGGTYLYLLGKMDRYRKHCQAMIDEAYSLPEADDGGYYGSEPESRQNGWHPDANDGNGGFIF